MFPQRRSVSLLTTSPPNQPQESPSHFKQNLGLHRGYCAATVFRNPIDLSTIPYAYFPARVRLLGLSSGRWIQYYVKAVDSSNGALLPESRRQSNSQQLSSSFARRNTLVCSNSFKNGWTNSWITCTHTAITRIFYVNVAENMIIMRSKRQFVPCWIHCVPANRSWKEICLMVHRRPQYRDFLIFFVVIYRDHSLQKVQETYDHIFR